MQFQILGFFVVILLAALASAASPDNISKRDAPKRMSSIEKREAPLVAFPPHIMQG
ncbi:hypothetical protein CpipJ_CPIJ003809 [Culex quinquefasciatus]|uniref:Uncharacterized protein n=1 Tax=Culex quinquefasciatus TaxID=7176 RepID=B0W9J8_CULQU|nr:hypothetical protein CpipJ_CPIJ003809 [Culex quinquefasciatus]|eukprot:XP_001845382.1 hypothetical protein CpipJ_CPIJ003809 [Culex quinquefasciatus]